MNTVLIVVTFLLFVHVVRCVHLNTNQQQQQQQQQQQRQQVTILQPLVESLSGSDDVKNIFTRYISASDARMEAAIGLTSNDVAQPFITLSKNALKELHHRLIAAALHPAFVRTDVNWQQALCDLYNLPGRSKENAAVTNMKMIDRMKSGVMGCSIDPIVFQQTDAADRIKSSMEYIHRVVEQGTLHELFELLMRASENGEGASRQDIASGVTAVGSLRYILEKAAQLLNQTQQTQARANITHDTGFDFEHLLAQINNAEAHPTLAATKTLLTPAISSWIARARPASGGYYKQRDKVIALPKYQTKTPWRFARFFKAVPDNANTKGTDMPKVPTKAVWDATLMKQLQMEPWSEHEIKFMKHVGLNPAAQVLQGSGGYVNYLAIGSDQVDQMIQQHNADLVEWRKIMKDNGLAAVGGPSGSTEEYAGTADYFGITKDPFTACQFRNAIFANMILQNHHSFEEIVEGIEPTSTAKRAAVLKAGLSLNKPTDDPWETLVACSKETKPTVQQPIPWSWSNRDTKPLFTTPTKLTTATVPNFWESVRSLFQKLTAEQASDQTTLALIDALKKTPKFAIDGSYQTQASALAQEVGVKFLISQLNFDEKETASLKKFCTDNWNNFAPHWKIVLESPVCKP